VPVMLLHSLALVADIRVLIAFIISAEQDNRATGVLATFYLYSVEKRGLEHGEGARNSKNLKYQVGL